MRTHTGEKPFVCDTCDARFVTCSLRKVHRKIRNVERPYKCDQCHLASLFNPWTVVNAFSRPYWREALQMRALRWCFPPMGVLTSTPAKDRTCGEAFAEASSMNHYIQRRHTDEKLFKCGICGSQYARQDGLRNHIVKHMLYFGYFGSVLYPRLIKFL